MKRYLLDTNICIYLFKKRHHILERMNQVGWENCYISEITLAELYYGASNDDFDLLIGCTAVHNKLIMVTENVKHLSRIPNILIENWIQDK